MTKEQLAKFICKHPTLYHMTEYGASEEIMKRGLLSTAAVLDLYKVSPEKREQIENLRSESIPITHPSLPDVMIRDQKPLNEKCLKKCLPDGWEPACWCKILNGKCFFWVRQKKLGTLQSAYEGQSCDVLEVDTRSLIKAHYDKIHLCCINSGHAKRKAADRDENTFVKIKNYPESIPRFSNGSRKPLQELTVDWAVPDIRDHIKYVERVRVKERIERFVINPHLCSQDS